MTTPLIPEPAKLRRRTNGFNTITVRAYTLAQMKKCWKDSRWIALEQAAQRMDDATGSEYYGDLIMELK